MTGGGRGRGGGTHVYVMERGERVVHCALCHCGVHCGVYCGVQCIEVCIVERKGCWRGMHCGIVVCIVLQCGLWFALHLALWYPLHCIVV